MADLITPIVISIFGGAILVIVLGFVLLIKRSGRPGFEAEDYYQTYKEPQRTPRYQPDYFRQKSQRAPRMQGDQRRIALLVVGLAILAIIVSSLFDVFDGLLIIFMLPIIVRFLRSRSASRSHPPQDESQSRY